jgi:glyoxylase-like metal-dependent hydrolase (beta-lactamase superfamily II)
MKVYPLFMGSFEANEGTLIRGGSPQKIVWFSSYIFYIEGLNKPTIIDTSFSDPTFCIEKLNHSCKREKNISINERLKKHGLSSDDIQQVILTHCHWDHIGGLDKFPNAIVYCQREEVSWSLAPPPWLSAAYPAALSDRLVTARERLVLLDGDTSLDNCLFLKKVGAHSPGSQIIEITTNSGKVIITGDAILFYRNFDEKIPIGTYHNLHDAMDVIRYLHNLNTVETITLLPGHDPEVQRRFPDGV